MYLFDFNDFKKGFHLKIDEASMTASLTSTDRIYGLGTGTYLTSAQGDKVFFAYFSDRGSDEIEAPDYKNRLFCILGNQVYDAYSSKNKFELKRNSLTTKAFKVNDLSCAYYYPIWKHFFYPLVPDYGGLLKDDIVDSFYNIYTRNRRF